VDTTPSNSRAHIPSTCTLGLHAGQAHRDPGTVIKTDHMMPNKTHGTDFRRFIFQTSVLTTTQFFIKNSHKLGVAKPRMNRTEKKDGGKR
jgi:hypothetical protein